MKPSAGVPRKKDFKKGTDIEDARRKREDNIIELRKTKRDENLQKKRMVHGGPSYAMEESSARGMALQNKVGGSRRRVPGPAGAHSSRLGPIVGQTSLGHRLNAAPVFLRAATGRAAHAGEGSVQPEHPGAV